MSWLAIAIIGYFFNAVSITINKALLSRDLPSASTVTFLIALLGLIVVVLIPFGVTMASGTVLLVSLVVGLTFVGAMYAMFYALKRGQASYVPIFIGALQPIFVFLLARAFLEEMLTRNQFIGFLLLTLGGIVIAMQKMKNKRYIYLIAILSSALFAITFAATKWVFEATDFINGFFWTRLLAFFSALLLLLSSHCRKEIFGVLKRKDKKKNTMAAIEFTAAQITGGISFIMIYYAFSIGSVTLVNALQGIQYAFIFLLVEPLGYFFPKLWKEDLTKAAIIRKIIAILIVFFGQKEL
jgi:drug/metabolite transporter (DMT)-like permease